MKERVEHGRNRTGTSGPAWYGCLPNREHGARREQGEGGARSAGESEALVLGEHADQERPGDRAAE
jgi:hypothetical protein